MNSDCLSNIYGFIHASKALTLSKKSAADHFPRKVVLSGSEEIEQFSRMSRIFDTSRLEEVVIEVSVRDGYIAMLGDVPRSVKRLTVRNDNHSRLAVPPTVEVLVIENSWQCHIDLPDGIKTLVLGKGFGGSIRTFPATLEELTIHGWNQPWGFASSTPVRLQNIPDTVRKIEIGAAAPVVVWRWPASVETVVLPKVHWGTSVWLEREHAELPEGVEVILEDDEALHPLVEVEPEEWRWSDDEAPEGDDYDSIWD
jgi:hypothetical protein